MRRMKNRAIRRQPACSEPARGAVEGRRAAFAAATGRASIDPESCLS